MEYSSQVYEFPRLKSSSLRLWKRILWSNLWMLINKVNWAAAARLCVFPHSPCAVSKQYPRVFQQGKSVIAAGCFDKKDQAVRQGECDNEWIVCRQPSQKECSIWSILIGLYLVQGNRYWTNVSPLGLQALRRWWSPKGETFVQYLFPCAQYE